MIEEGSFREDLYHRLSVILIEVPSLNERRDDIPLLANFFIDKVCKEYGTATKVFTDGALKALQNVDWTGNIRELRNIVERLVILCPHEIGESDVKLHVK
jgi:DNA-binding NtrC family response regulator